MGSNNSKNFHITILCEGDCLTVPLLEDCVWDNIIKNDVYYLLRQIALELLKGNEDAYSKFCSERPYVKSTEIVTNLLTIKLGEDEEEIKLDVPHFNDYQVMRDIVDKYCGRTKKEYTFQGSYKELMEKLDSEHESSTKTYTTIEHWRALPRKEMEENLAFAKLFANENDEILEKMMKRHEEATDESRMLEFKNGGDVEFVVGEKKISYSCLRPPCEGWIKTKTGFAKEKGLTVCWDDHCIDVIDKYKEIFSGEKSKKKIKT